jgi:hypothetical protein
MTTSSLDSETQTLGSLQNFEGKKVTLVRLLPKPDENGFTVAEIKGTIEKGRDGVGVALRLKGKSQTILIDEDEIDSITVESSATTKLKAKRVDPVKSSKMRQHLLMTHGLTLVYANTLTDEQAVEIHATLDHTILGHFHAVAPPKNDKASNTTPREAAIAEAEQQ